MAQKKVVNKDEVQKRAERVAKCKQCNGAPPTHVCNLQGLVFNMCELCMEVVGEYHKIGKPIRVTKEVTTNRDFRDPNFGHTITEELTPGKQLSFNDLEI